MFDQELALEILQQIQDASEKGTQEIKNNRIISPGNLTVR
jgi:hypothetical protein